MSTLAAGYSIDNVYRMGALLAVDRFLLACMLGAALIGSSAYSQELTAGSTFADDVRFLRQYTTIVVLSDQGGKGHLAVAPAWQGRVMTSSAEGVDGQSFGWINRKLIASGKVLPHFNPLGGEDRVWLGPEGGQFSIYFAPHAPFDLAHWFVPSAFDTKSFRILDESVPDHLSFESDFELRNYSGTAFKVRLQRTVRVLEPMAAWQALSMAPPEHVALVAYESRNSLTNAGTVPWRKETGLLSIWVLGMFNPSAATTIVIPIRGGPETALGRIVTTDYFGAVPADRLHVTDSAIFLRADGKYRSKIGISPQRSLAKLGSYDAHHHVLTIVQFDQPRGVTDYVNSLWHIQNAPYSGDVANAYNDGPPAPGVAPMGPFFELETSSPAIALAAGQSVSHAHRTIHLIGPADELDRISRAVLGVSLLDMQSAFGSK